MWKRRRRISNEPGGKFDRAVVGIGMYAEIEVNA